MSDAGWDLVPDAVLAIAPDGTLAAGNAAAVDLLGDLRGRIGRPAVEALADGAAAAADAVQPDASPLDGEGDAERPAAGPLPVEAAILSAEEVADAMIASWTSGEPGAAYIVQPGIGAVPVQAIQALPYLLTVFLLAGFIGRSVAPRALGRPYVKEK